MKDTLPALNMMTTTNLWKENQKMLDKETKNIIPEEDWNEQVDDPREIEWKNCYTPEERIAISKKILDNLENVKFIERI